MLEVSLWIVISLIAVSLIFDFTNGFHDAANSIATVVATKTLTPIQAVSLAAFFNFVIMFFINFNVAATIGKGLINPQSITLYIVFACLLAAIMWNLITWWLGLPTSSSHALIGGLVGAAVASSGWEVVNDTTLYKIISFIIAAPIIGFLLGGLINVVLFTFCKNVRDKWFRALQIVSSSMYSMGHGANDAQKTAGIIFLILLASGYLSPTDSVPSWAIVSCFAVMGLGTLLGGWRIVETLGFKLTKLNPRQGFSAEFGGSLMLFVASYAGIPVSTTHTITGAILGAGASQPKPDVKWKKAREILIAWLLTIPCSGFLAYAIWSVVNSLR